VKKEILDEAFPIVLELISQEHSRHLRLISGNEIVRLLLLNSHAKAIIDAARQQQPGVSAEQLTSNLVASFARSAIASGTEWHSRVAALQIGGEWFFRDKPIDYLPLDFVPELDTNVIR
jgi:hypothetical protein